MPWPTLAQGRTTLVIAHRLATVRRATVSSCSTAAGSWRPARTTALTRQGGLYAELASLQFGEIAA